MSGSALICPAVSAQSSTGTKAPSLGTGAIGGGCQQLLRDSCSFVHLGAAISRGEEGISLCRVARG